MNRLTKNLCVLATVLLLFTSCQRREYDVILRGGQVYDGSGKPPKVADVAIKSDTIALIGDLSKARGKKEMDVRGLAVAPGFINMLSWANESLEIDGKSQSDIRQGVTLEVMGEGISMGPIMNVTLGDKMEALERKGISTNIASFVGATSVRIGVLGYENRLPGEEEIAKMQDLVRIAMEEGAMGVGSSLIYAPANYSSTRELIALCQVAARYGGMYISHMRSEGNAIFQAVAETIQIAKEANLPAEIYHLKMAGKDNWNKLDSVLAMIESANQLGLRITADMYTYTAGSTGLDACIPPWVQDGRFIQWVMRLQKPKLRSRVLADMRTPTDKWENLLLMAGGAEQVLLVQFESDSLKKYTGMTLAEVADIYRKSPEETILDLIFRDGSRVGAVYFMMSEDNIRKQIALPFVSFGSDAVSAAPEGVFLKSSTHPRAYGNFARLLAKYVREEKVISLEEAIRRLTSLPATNLKVKKRGTLKEGYFADIAIFDPAKVQDHATFERPQQYSTGMVHVLVNGKLVLENGDHTGQLPGRVVRGPGWKGH